MGLRRAASRSRAAAPERPTGVNRHAPDIGQHGRKSQTPLDKFEQRKAAQRDAAQQRLTKRARMAPEDALTQISLWLLPIHLTP